MVINPVQVSALVTTAGFTLTVMGILVGPVMAPLLGLTVNHGCLATPRPCRTLGLSAPHDPDATTADGSELAVELSLMVCAAGGACGVWKLKIRVEGVQFNNGLFDTFKVTGT